MLLWQAGSQPPRIVQDGTEVILTPHIGWKRLETRPGLMRQILTKECYSPVLMWRRDQKFFREKSFRKSAEAL